jgi:hypothetical protein
MDKIQIAKKVIRLIVTTSVSGTIVTMIHAGTPTSSKLQKAKLYIGAIVVGQLVADKAGDWTDAQIEAIVKAYKELTAPKPVEQ